MGFFKWFEHNSSHAVISERTGNSKILTIIAEGGVDKSKRWDPLQTKIKYSESWDIMKPYAEKFCGIKGLYFEDGILRYDKHEDFKDDDPICPDINIENIEGLSVPQLTTLFPDLVEPFKKVAELVKAKKVGNTKKVLEIMQSDSTEVTKIVPKTVKKDIVNIASDKSKVNAEEKKAESYVNGDSAVNTNELQIVDPKNLDLNKKEILELSSTIDRAIESLKNNREEINRLTFECVAAMTEADDAQKDLSRKGTLSRWIGNITGTNQKLQNKINKNRSVAQYAAQQTLQKMEEQNLMTFELIAEVNNKLNKSLLQVDDKLKIIYERLLSFFVRCYDKLQEKQGLTIWLTTIRNQKFCDTKYIELGTVAKIVCIVRDFYDKTRGNWNENDLPILETAIDSLALQPNEKVNYFNILCEIASNKSLKEKLLGNIVLQQVSKTEDLISTSVLKKYDSLENKDSFIVDTVVKSLKKNGLDSERKIVCANLTKEYSEGKFSRKLDIDIECFDLVLDLLENLKKIDERK